MPFHKFAAKHLRPSTTTHGKATACACRSPWVVVVVRAAGEPAGVVRALGVLFP